MQQPDILGILLCSEPFHNCVPMHAHDPSIFTKIGKPFATLKIQSNGLFKPNTYWEPSKRFKCFIKRVKSYDYFSKALFLRSLTGIWICPSLNKYSVTCRLTSAYVLSDTYSEDWHIQNLVYYRKFRHIQAYSRPIQT